MTLPSKHPSPAKRIRGLNSAMSGLLLGKLAPISATGNMEWVGGKSKKNHNRKEKRCQTKSHRMSIKNRNDRWSRDLPTLTNLPWEATAAAELLKRGSGDLGSHTGPQSSWSGFWGAFGLSEWTLYFIHQKLKDCIFLKLVSSWSLWSASLKLLV